MYSIFYYVKIELQYYFFEVYYIIIIFARLLELKNIYCGSKV